MNLWRKKQKRHPANDLISLFVFLIVIFVFKMKDSNQRIETDIEIETGIEIDGIKIKIDFIEIYCFFCPIEAAKFLYCSALISGGLGLLSLRIFRIVISIIQFI